MTNLNPNDMEGSDLIETSISSDDHANSLTESNLNSVSVPVSTPPDPFNERFTLAVQHHKDGIAGNAAAVQEAHQILEQLRVDYPDNPLVDAYYGSTMILIARDKTEASDKLKWSNQGLKILDDAVAADPHDSTIRLLRGKSSYNLPEKYFRRTKTVIEDFTLLLNTQSDTLDTDTQLELIYELGEACARIGRNQDAATHFRRLQSQTQNSAWQHLSKQKLQALEGKPAFEKMPNNIPATLLIEATRAVGNALLIWINNEKKKEIAQQKAKERAKKRALEKAKEEAIEKAKERAKKKAEEMALEKERELTLEKERQMALEKEREMALEKERQVALEELRKMALKKSKEKAKPKTKLITNRKGKPLAKAKSKPKAKEVVKPKSSRIQKNKAYRTAIR
ncbi:hypothetical protein ABE142_23080 [Paenibacillus alvei]|uniref:hypothetical protein n=1 Tax=Paenibacillus alvei TaxID=44250 RepID=UPI003D2D3388